MTRQNQQPSTVSMGNIATAKDVVAAVAAIGLPLPGRPALEAISAHCRDTFLEALRACVTKKDSDGAKRAYVENVLACLDPSVAATLKALNLNAEPSELIGIAGFRPARFRSAIAVASDVAHERHEEAVQFLRVLVEMKPWLEPSATQPQNTGGSIYDIPGMPPDPHAPVVTQPADTSQNERRRPAPVASNEVQESPTGRHVQAASHPAQQATNSPSEATMEKFRSHHVYGSDFALCFNASTSMDGKPSIMIDAAAANGQRSYDWKNAIHIMLDVREVTCVLAVFRKWRPQVEFSAHGKRNDKSFSLAWQGPHFYCKVSARMDHKPVRAVKIMSHDAIQVAMLFLEQLLLAYPNVPASEVLELARSVNTFDDRKVAHQ
ncbi:hypothetical protein RY831_03330 [Noviherbaspirillum sp. CPCC 100848]|uniref:Uncharacterized protein n=1 Tax=Noviherbaspirillum album TaxID=3080276 RepID=A0ABU6J473_9BURK|nr:hypothetical protein [Noviherbaspirillum sp. CPCC 100848]MEC4718165.1 hypothetical protein [Noviherbaspirillum sp. CPCC 100848]